MKTRFTAALSIALACAAASLTSGKPPRDQAEDAISSDPAVAQTAQKQLRDSGPQGLELLERRFAREIAAYRNHAMPDDRWPRISAALDRVGGQYRNVDSGLYWYTDMEKARSAALAAGRPILSLRLLGHLDEDLSCANSRYFRTTLYPEPAINTLLKNRFVLHWESMRPVPVVTISFGDGRTLRRTITGNSIHYILDAHGKPVDALPGLYSADVFAEELRLAADAVSRASDDRETGGYSAHLSSTRLRLLRAWAADMQALGVAPADKGALEESVVEQSTDDKTWRMIAQLHRTADLAVPQLTVVQAFPSAQAAAPLAVSKQRVESPVLKQIANLSQTIALDTVRDNYLLRPKILGFLATPRAISLPLSSIDDWIYAQVFLAPREDPWYGLAPADIYAAIDGNGEVQPQSQEEATRKARD